MALLGAHDWNNYYQFKINILQAAEYYTSYLWYLPRLTYHSRELVTLIFAVVDGVCLK